MAASPPWNILLVVYSLGPGGSERQAATLARSLNPDLFRPHVGATFADGMRAAELKAAGVPVFEIPLRSLTDRTALATIGVLRRYIREHNIQILHTFDAPSTVFAPPLARVLRVPAVFTSQRSYAGLAASKYQRLIRFSHRLADGVIANCQAMRGHLIEAYGVPDRKIHVCYNGVDTSLFHALDRQRLPALASASLVIGSVGLLRPEKNLALLLDAFARVLPLDPAMKLVLVGDGEDRPALEQRASGLGIRNACLFQAAVADVAPWYRSIDIFVLPSKSEAFSNSLLEAMACGCCVAASRVGGNPEVVTPGETGCLFPSGNTDALARELETLILDRELRLRLAATAADHVGSRFSVAASAACLEQAYRSVL